MLSICTLLDNYSMRELAVKMENEKVGKWTMTLKVGGSWLITIVSFSLYLPIIVMNIMNLFVSFIPFSLY